MDGHKKALELIAENKRTRSPFLDLGNLGLTEVPEEVFECVWLEYLNLGTAIWKGFDWDTLNMEAKKGFDINQIEVISPEIQQLEKLTRLTLRENKIKDLSWLKNLTKLEILDLHTNNIEDINPIKNLKNLWFLDLKKNTIQNIDELGSLKKLQVLDVSDNLIETLPFSILRSSLEIKWLYDSKDKDIYVGGNPFKVPPVEIVKRGKEAIISYLTSINTKSIRELIDNVIGVYIQSRDIKSIHQEEIEQLLDSILIGNEIYEDIYLSKFEKNYWSNEIAVEIDVQINHNVNRHKITFFAKIINADEEISIPNPIDTHNIQGSKIEKNIGIKLQHPRPLNQLKTLLVGDGLSGKTSLLKQILKKDFDAGEPQTHGINIHPKDIEIEGENIHVKFWDFGGQEIMHGTHTFFYSKRSIYLLVLDARREGKEDYWLKHIESFGGDSSVLVVLNKIDENPSFDVNRAFLQGKYPNIVGFVRVSCKTGDGIDRLVQELEKQIHALEMRRTPFAKSWFEVKEALDTMGEDYISYDRYYALCREKEVTDETAQNVLLQFLHDLGIVLAFRNLELHDTQVINPLWLTNAVYRIINSKLVARKKGYLHLSDLDAILNDPAYAHEGFKYPRNKFLYILKIMQEFELCYAIEHEKVYVVPDLLTVEEQPVPGFGYNTALRFVLQYDFLPASVLPRFMVQLHTRIVEGEQWRTGTALEDPIFKSKAVVKADRDEKRLYLWVIGPDRDSRRNFFNFIRKTLHDIHDSFEKLTVTELVPVPGHDDVFIEYAELVGYEEMGLADYPVGKLRRKFNVGEMLSGLEAPERRQPRRHAPVKVFVSYSHKDTDYKDELVTALAYLSRMEEIELWQDGRIEAGMEWKKEIFEKLAEAEIVICLVSSNFIASDFCYSIELKEALEGHEAGTKIVVPIQIKTCAWTKLPFGKIQGVPPKPISSYSPHDDGWGEVFKGMEGAVKRIRGKRKF
jgi:internalin A